MAVVVAFGAAWPAVVVFVVAVAVVVVVAVVAGAAAAALVAAAISSEWNHRHVRLSDSRTRPPARRQIWPTICEQTGQTSAQQAPPSRASEFAAPVGRALQARPRFVDLFRCNELISGR